MANTNTEDAVEVLKFEADWCGPCSQQADLLEDFDAAPIRSIDVDEDQKTANEYGVRGIPLLVVEVDGEEVERFSGVTQPSKLVEAVSQHE